MTRLSLTLPAPPGRGPEISAALRALARLARQEWGCLSSDVYACVEDQNRIFMQVDWSDLRTMSSYVRSDEFTRLLTLIEMAAAPPTLEFQLDGKVRGLDYVAEVRRDMESA